MKDKHFFSIDSVSSKMRNSTSKSEITSYLFPHSLQRNQTTFIQDPQGVCPSFKVKLNLNARMLLWHSITNWCITLTCQGCLVNQLASTFNPTGLTNLSYAHKSLPVPPFWDDSRLSGEMEGFSLSRSGLRSGLLCSLFPHPPTGGVETDISPVKRSLKLPGYVNHSAWKMF